MKLPHCECAAKVVVITSQIAIPLDVTSRSANSPPVIASNENDQRADNEVMNDLSCVNPARPETPDQR